MRLARVTAAMVRSIFIMDSSGVVTCGLTPAGVNLFKGFARFSQMEGEGRRAPGAERVGGATH